MDDSNYSKRELDHYFDDLKSRLSKQDLTLSRIEADGKETKTQAYKTNGRVSKLEWWQKALIWTFTAIIVPTIFFVLNKLL